MEAQCNSQLLPYHHRLSRSPDPRLADPNCFTSPSTQSVFNAVSRCASKITNNMHPEQNKGRRLSRVKHLQSKFYFHPGTRYTDAAPYASSHTHALTVVKPVATFNVDTSHLSPYSTSINPYSTSISSGSLVTLSSGEMRWLVSLSASFHSGHFPQGQDPWPSLPDLPLFHQATTTSFTISRPPHYLTSTPPSTNQ